MKECKASCIACGMCAKNCPVEAITVENMHAHIDQEKCIGCGTCKEKCKRNSIVDLMG